jgi:amino-acid N-acetyltransferase
MGESHGATTVFASAVFCVIATLWFLGHDSSLVLLASLSIPHVLCSSTLLDSHNSNVVSGNFYSAQPLGVHDGVDYQYTGFVRRIEVEKIQQLHAQRDICLLSTLGVSPSGEVFNVNSESLAAITAGSLKASKVVYFTERETEIRHKIHDNKIQSFRMSDAKNLLRYHGITMHRKGYTTLKDAETDEEEAKKWTAAEMEMLLKIGWCTEAIFQGVKRAHIISPQHGALLQELYTRDGSGTLISADLYEGIRRATVLDVSAIHQLISPLIAAGTLIDRPKAVLENDIDTYYLYTRDNLIVACGQLKKFENGFVEIGCLVVNKDYRSAGRGDAMLGYLERLCLLNGCTNVFVLSTQTMEWFVERGFEEAVVEQLPPSRQATYNHARKSKIYLKKIESDRDLDASELWWNR